MRELSEARPDLAASVRAYLQFCPTDERLATPVEHLWMDYQVYGGRVGYREFLGALIGLQLFPIRRAHDRLVVEGVAPNPP